MCWNNCAAHLCLTRYVTRLKFNRQISPCGFGEGTSLFGSSQATLSETNITCTPEVLGIFSAEKYLLIISQLILFHSQEQLHYCWWQKLRASWCCIQVWGAVYLKMGLSMFAAAKPSTQPMLLRNWTHHHEQLQLRGPHRFIAKVPSGFGWYIEGVLVIK